MTVESAIMYTVTARNSPFLTELVTDGVVAITDIEGEPIREERCPVCKHGVLIQRTGKFGDFTSCSGFPRCKYKPKKNKAKEAPAHAPRPCR